jgi:hypothetical protein
MPGPATWDGHPRCHPAGRRGCGHGGEHPDVTSGCPAEEPALLVHGKRALLRPGNRTASPPGGPGAGSLPMHRRVQWPLPRNRNQEPR